MNKLLPFFFLLPLLIMLSWQASAQGSGRAIAFDGIDGYVESSNSNRGISNQVTLEAWVNTTALKYQWVVGKYDRYGAQQGYHLIIKDGKAAMAGRDGSGIYRNSGFSNKTVNDGKWHHLTGVCDGLTWSIYVDGVFQTSITTNYPYTSLTNSAPLAVGKYFVYDEEFFLGKIDEVRVWKTALTAEEIRKSMCSKIASPPTDLVAYYNFDEASGTIAKDLSSLRLDGSIRNLNTNTARITSGAPIGDRSTYLYTSDWQNKQVELVNSEGDKFSATTSSAYVQGLHVYHIASAPNSRTGIEDPTQVIDYYGVFKAGSTSGTYSVQYELATATCTKSLYRRDNNADASWGKIADAPITEVLTSTETGAQGEFAYNAGNATPVIIQSTGDFCTGSSATLSINATGNILWSTGETTKSITVARAGTYTVTVTSEVCTYSDAVTLDEITLPTVDLGPDILLCTGQSKTLSAPAGMKAYKWSTGETTQNITLRIAGVYWVEVTNANGCVSRDEVLVSVQEEPEIPVPTEVIACAGAKVTLNATVPGATYLWSNGETTSSIEVTAPAQVNLAVTVGNCTYTRSISVITPAISSVSIQSTGDFCSGSSSTLSIQASGSVLWSTGETGSSITVTNPGTYGVTVTIAGCTYTDEVTVREIALPSFNLGDDLILCAGETAYLQAPAGYTYKWSNGQTASSIEVSDTGTYWVEVTNSQGCVLRDEIKVTIKPAIATPLPEEVYACYGDKVTLDAFTEGATYQWINGLTTPTVEVTSPAKLSVTVSLDGCGITKEVTVLSDECPVIPNVITPNGDRKNDAFVVNGVESNTLGISIFNRWGKCIYKADRYGNNWAATNAPAGTYYYQLSSSRSGKIYKGWLEVIK